MKQERWISRYFYTLLFLLLAVAVITITGSCGSGGGGGGNSGGENSSESGSGGTTPLATGTFTKTVKLFGTDTNYGNLFNTNISNRYQMLYRAQEINGAGYITSISFQYEAGIAAAVNCPNETIKMGHTNLTGLTATFAANVQIGQGSLVTVLNDAGINIPAGNAGEYFNITLAQPFYYNGVDNLAVEISRTSACSGSVVVDADIASTSYNALNYNGSDAAGATGSLFTYLANTRFTFVGGDNAPFAVGGASNQIPFTSNAIMQRVQNLYLAGDINGSGPITGVGMEIGALTTAQTYTVTLKLGHATVNTLAANYDANYSGLPTTVANAVTFTVPEGVPAGSYVWIPVTGSFNYNGTDNLLLEIIVSSATGGMYYTFHNHNIANVRLIYGPNDASNITTITTVIQHAKFRFNGGTMDVIGPNNAGTTVFSNTANGRQFLLRSAELGTSGPVNKLACRFESVSSTAASYPNFTITLAHTTQTALVATDAANVAGGITVYNGTFNIPAGLLMGDWVEIPFSTPFSYNGVDNLVVQTTTGAGSLNQMCQISGPDATWFLGRRKAMGGIAPVDYRGTFRFWIAK